MDIYKNLFIDTAALLKPIGYTKKRSFFYLKKENNWGVIDFQKSTKTTATNTLFTINLGICSSVLRAWRSRLMPGEDLASPPDLLQCQWQMRIGDLLPRPGDHWWEINENTSYEALSKDVFSFILDLAVPKIEKYIKDESLEEYWLEGKNGGLTPAGVYRSLAVLLKTYNRDNLDEFIKKWKEAEKRNINLVNQFLTDLGYEEGKTS